MCIHLLAEGCAPGCFRWLSCLPGEGRMGKSGTPRHSVRLPGAPRLEIDAQTEHQGAGCDQGLAPEPDASPDGQMIGMRPIVQIMCASTERIDLFVIPIQYQCARRD